MSKRNNQSEEYRWHRNIKLLLVCLFIRQKHVCLFLKACEYLCAIWSDTWHVILSAYLGRRGRHGTILLCSQKGCFLSMHLQASAESHWSLHGSSQCFLALQLQVSDFSLEHHAVARYTFTHILLWLTWSEDG